VKVHYDEGVTIHIDLEPCIAIREDGGEASVEERTGQAMEPRKFSIPGADGVPLPEGNTGGYDQASARLSRRGRRTWHARTRLAREPGDLRVGPGGTRPGVRTGKVRSRSR
jgi:hypothetical protein